ncbi:MAG: DUF421 domain-containing protein [Clostridia bacterium]|nr:DUF421 domain-containing protein [Clostridia bacterium]
MLISVIRTVIIYFFVIAAIRLMGKRQIGDMQPGELVVTLLISEIAAIPLQDSSQPLILGLSAMFTLVALEIVMSILAMKSLKIRKLISGKSVVVIKNGVIDQKAMRRVRLTVLDLIELLRAQEVFSLDNVSYAVLEVNGSLSVLLKEDKQPLTPKTLKTNPQKEGMPLPVISDGKIVEESLSALEVSREEVVKLVLANGLEVAEVFLLSLDRYGNFTLTKKGQK